MSWLLREEEDIFFKFKEVVVRGGVGEGRDGGGGRSVLNGSGGERWWRW